MYPTALTALWIRVIFNIVAMTGTPRPACPSNLAGVACNSSSAVGTPRVPNWENGLQRKKNFF